MRFKGWTVRLWIHGAGGPRERRQLALAISKMASKTFGAFLGPNWITHPDGYWANIERDEGREIPLNRAASFETDEARFGFEIRMRRLKAGLSQRELARRAGLDHSHLSLLERGRCRMRESTFARIHNALKDVESRPAKPGKPAKPAKPGKGEREGPQMESLENQPSPEFERGVG